MIVRSNLLVASCVVILFSGCIATRPFEQIECELNENPVRATFPVPPPCTYITPLNGSAALVGTWSASGSMDGVDYSPRYIPPKRWSAAWDKSFTFSSDGSYSMIDKFNGRVVRANGRWSYSDGMLVLDIAGKGKTNTHREYRLHWLDSKTFDLRWSSDSAEAAWWKDWVLDKGNYAGWDNSVVVTYDSSGCKRQTSRMRKGKTGVIYDVLYPPIRYKCSSGGCSTCSSAGPVAEIAVPVEDKTIHSLESGNEGAPTSSSTVEIDSIPL